MGNKLKIMETAIRDGQQSLIATRMPMSDMKPILATMDSAGYDAIECWGGATFDSCIRFLDEDPWERLRTFREMMPNTRLQMLLRGQNLLGYRHYADDLVDEFVKKSIENGIDNLRIFDALNDLRNVSSAVESAKKYGAHVQLGMSYTIGEPYTLEYWEKLALAMQEMGADSICVKDMAGLMLPDAATELIGMLKEKISIPIHLHSHCTSGTAPMTYYAAVQAGVDGIDTAISPFSGGTSQPPTEAMYETFKRIGRDAELDINALQKIAEHFEGVKTRALESGLMSTKVLGTDIKTLIYQVPGGMLSNLISQLKDQNAEDRYEDVLKEIPQVRLDLGMPPLVTPSSQIVGTQAVLNVLAGERYMMLSKETRELLLGKYGATTLPVDQELLKKVEGEEIITCRPADLLPPDLPGLKEEIKEYMIQDEDVLTYALFGQTALDYFKRRSALADKVAPSAIDHANKAYPA